MGARKLRVKRRLNWWADLGYKKAHQNAKWKNPFAGASHAAGIVVEKIGVEPSSLTLLSVNASESSSERTTRESRPTSPEMEVCLSSMRTTKSSLLDSVDPVTPSVIFPVSVSRSSRSLEPVSSPSGSERRISQSHEERNASTHSVSFR